ncbi:amphi-Trp domain-containing protein [Mariprofundus sp. EBB-1]|uniref:amphi-Trp domain-containing protein n=1 Tax=Mariprofundus sp. EBB-1 TaxID=2650971 RepID=UPI000EF227FE|nr:amphi-Trp domain-containing protein [Mariprofundus sp. EBB-1]RLL51894.1 amphi-Trp domain-containing protein [Mariprofundus sp. EBB-1]
MQQSKKVFHHESLEDTKSLRSLMQAVTDGLESGELSFSDDSDEIIMIPKGLLHFKLAAAQEEGRNRINIRVTWHDDVDTKPAKKSLAIRSKQKEKRKGG